MASSHDSCCVSSIRLVGNEVYRLEYPDDFLLGDSGYFVVRIQHLPHSAIRLDAIDFLSTTHPLLHDKPKAAHIHRDVLTLFYTLPTEMLQRRYCDIISYFVGYLSVKHSTIGLKCNIIQFETKAQVLSFMIYHNRNLYFEFLMTLSPKITKKDVLERALFELEDILRSEGIDLKKYTASQKYGEFLKVSLGKVKSMPGIKNIKNEGKYLSFIYT